MYVSLSKRARNESVYFIQEYIQTCSGGGRVRERERGREREKGSVQGWRNNLPTQSFSSPITASSSSSSSTTALPREKESVVVAQVCVCACVCVLDHFRKHHKQNKTKQQLPPLPPPPRYFHYYDRCSYVCVVLIFFAGQIDWSHVYVYVYVHFLFFCVWMVLCRYFLEI